MVLKAKKVVIITEKLIQDDVLKVIEGAGATGYTVMDTGGKGRRGIRSSAHPGLSDAYLNVQIEVITPSEETAHRIADGVAERFFENFAGIAYLQDVEFLRPPPAGSP